MAIVSVPFLFDTSTDWAIDKLTLKTEGWRIFTTDDFTTGAFLRNQTNQNCIIYAVDGDFSE